MLFVLGTSSDFTFNVHINWRICYFSVSCIFLKSKQARLQLFTFFYILRSSMSEDFEKDQSEYKRFIFQRSKKSQLYRQNGGKRCQVNLARSNYCLLKLMRVEMAEKSLRDGPGRFRTHEKNVERYSTLSTLRLEVVSSSGNERNKRA